LLLHGLSSGTQLLLFVVKLLGLATVLLDLLALLLDGQLLLAELFLLLTSAGDGFLSELGEDASLLVTVGRPVGGCSPSQVSGSSVKSSFLLLDFLVHSVQVSRG